VGVVDGGEEAAEELQAFALGEVALEAEATWARLDDVHERGGEPVFGNPPSRSLTMGGVVEGRRVRFPGEASRREGSPRAEGDELDGDALGRTARRRGKLRRPTPCRGADEADEAVAVDAAPERSSGMLETSQLDDDGRWTGFDPTGESW